MTIDSENLLNSILESLERIEYIRPEDIPGIDLYMDQVTTFMDARLRSSARNPGGDKILTKTMINNYAKNDLLPPPVKKKYSKEHLLMLIFIYYFKGILSINDIQTLFRPISEHFFQKKEGVSLESIYKEVIRMEKVQVEGIKSDLAEKFRCAGESFSEEEGEDGEFLRKFSFICLLAFDVYLKKSIIEKMIDELSEDGKKK